MKATLDDLPIGQHDECFSLSVLTTLGDADAATRFHEECLPPLRSWLACHMPWQIAEASEMGGADEDQRLAALTCCVEALPERQRDMPHLRYDKGWSSEAIAVAQGRTRVATAVNLHRLCSRLRTNIEQFLQSSGQAGAADRNTTFAT